MPNRINYKALPPYIATYGGAVATPEIYKATATGKRLLIDHEPDTPPPPDPTTYVQYPFATPAELEVQRKRLVGSAGVYVPADTLLTRTRYTEFMASASNRTSERPAMPSATFTDRQGKHKRFSDAAYTYRLRRLDNTWPPSEKANCLTYLKAEFDWMVSQPGWDYANVAWDNNAAYTFVDFAHKSMVSMAYNAIWPDVDAAFRKKVDTWGWNIMYRATFGIFLYNLVRLFGNRTWANLDAENYAHSSLASFAINSAEPLFKYHKDFTPSKYPNTSFSRQWSNRGSMHPICAYGWARQFKENGFTGDREKLHKFVSQPAAGASYDRYYDFDTSKTNNNASNVGYSTADVTDSLIASTLNMVIRGAKLWFKTEKMFATFGNGMGIEFYRGGRETGYQYHISLLQVQMFVELDLARRGDTELINLSTRVGKSENKTLLDPSDPNKSTKRSIELIAKMAENHVDYRYYNSTTADADYRIDGFDSLAAPDIFYRFEEWAWIYNFWNQTSGDNDAYINNYCRQTSIFNVGRPSIKTILGNNEYYQGLFGCCDQLSNRYNRMVDDL